MCTYLIFLKSHYTYIIGVIGSRGHGVLPWTLTDPAVGNRWRVLARGHRVLSYMMWLYCDDTSGNMSKKWNKHNSFLFTAAGLPRAMVHQESNIHFLATSNIAPPLEMLDGIVEQLEQVVFTHSINKQATDQVVSQACTSPRYMGLGRRGQGDGPYHPCSTSHAR